MKKRLISLIVAVVMLFSMLCPAAYADDETVSFDTCVHEWETPIRSGYSIAIPNSDFSFGVNVEQCKKCKWYKHVATIIVAEFTYYSPFNVNENAEMIKPLRRGLWFVLDRDYNAYDTLAVVDNLQKKFEEGDILTESEIISNQAPAGPLGLEVASRPTKKARRRMSGQIKR